MNFFEVILSASDFAFLINLLSIISEHGGIDTRCTKEDCEKMKEKLYNAKVAKGGD